MKTVELNPFSFWPATSEDIAVFFRYLHEVRDITFHPDEDFLNYINVNTHKPTFSTEEAERLNLILEECFQITEHEGTDIYEIGLTIVRPDWNQVE